MGREGGREGVCVCVWGGGGGGGRDKGKGLKLGTMRAGIVNVPPPSTYLCLAYIGNLRPSITLLNN